MRASQRAEEVRPPNNELHITNIAVRAQGLVIDCDHLVGALPQPTLLQMCDLLKLTGEADSGRQTTFRTSSALMLLSVKQAGYYSFFRNLSFLISDHSI